jgi:hypothetical protein
MRAGVGQALTLAAGLRRVVAGGDSEIGQGLGQVIAAVLLAVAIGTRIFVHLGLLRQVSLGRQCRHGGAFRILKRARCLVIEGPGGKRCALQCPGS